METEGTREMNKPEPESPLRVVKASFSRISLQSKKVEEICPLGSQNLFYENYIFLVT